MISKRRLAILDAAGARLAELGWSTDGTSVIEAMPHYAPAVQRWARRGLSEWVRWSRSEPAMHRHTRPEAAEFLPRLAEYLRRNYALTVAMLDCIDDQGLPDAPDVRRVEGARSQLVQMASLAGAYVVVHARMVKGVRRANAANESRVLLSSISGTVLKATGDSSVTASEGVA